MSGKKLVVFRDGTFGLFHVRFHDGMAYVIRYGQFVQLISTGTDEFMER